MATNRVNQLLGKYRLTDYLGRGGFAEVYLGEHQLLKSYAALKVLHVTLTKDMVDAFLLEAQTLARLVHPNIVRVLDFDTQRGTPFIVMEYVPGGTLRNHIPRGTCLPLSTVVFYVTQIASALQFAHDHHVIHRDIKPDNMLLATEQHLLLSDFGLALFAANQLSTQPELEGTISYSAPEQLHGKPVFASDQYSLGIVAYEWLCGVRPFEGGGPLQIANQHFFRPPRPLREILPDLPQAVEAVVLRALAKEPQERFPDVQSFSQALEQSCSSSTSKMDDTEITSPRRSIPRTAAAPAAPRKAAFTRVFLSYPSANEDFAKRLKADLSKRGVFFTNDYIFRPADQHDPEQIMRQAIRVAQVVLVVNSQATRSSRTIKEHLRVVAAYQKRLAYVWISGPGAASLPFDAHAEVIDARQHRYPQALDDIIEYLNEDVITANSPSVTRPEGKEPRNPYKGLRAFTMDEAGDFFGRDRLIDNLARKVQMLATEQPQSMGNRLLALIGPSGSGKSSAMMAGLLPRLRLDMLPGSKQWVYLGPMRPGQRPAESLTTMLAQQFPHLTPQSIYTDLGEESARGLHLFAETLARQVRQPDPRIGPRVVLVIDQFEEIFSPVVSERERQHFFALLTTATTEPGGPLVVLLTLRADFYGHIMQYQELSRLIEMNHVPMIPMDLDDLRAVIEGPAALPDVQVSFEGNLAGDLLFEAQGQAGALPLLEFTLDQLFELRQDNMLTLPAYKQIGGVKGALVKCAEAVYTQLPNEEYRALTRALFLRLIDPGPTSQDATRRRAALNELALANEQQRTITSSIADAFVAARLLVVNEQGGERTIEVSHEALIEHWPRLFAWLREARSDIILQRSISNDTREWLRRGRPLDRLYSGSELVEAQAWVERNFPNQDEAEFLSASVAEQNRKENEERARQQEQIRMQQEQIRMQQEQIKLQHNITKHQRRLLAVLSIFTIIVIILGSLAGIYYVDARRQELLANAAKTSAETEARQSNSRALAASVDLALSQNNLDLALLLGVKATQSDTSIEPTPEGRASLLNALEASPHIITMLRETDRDHHTSPVHALAFSSDGTTLFSTRGISSPGETPSFPHIDTTILQWKLSNKSHQQLHLKSVPANAPFIGRVAFGSDDHTFGIANTNGIWLQIGDQSIQLDGSSPSPKAASLTTTTPITFSADGRSIAASRCTAYTPAPDPTQASQCNTTTISIWSVQTAPQKHSPITTFTINTEVTSIALSTDGTKLASVSNAGITLWDVASRQQLFSLMDNSAGTHCIAFSPDGTMLAGGNDDKTVHLWDVATGNVIKQRPFIGHDGSIIALAFNPKGTLLASASMDKTVRLWNVASGVQVGTPLTGHAEQITSIVFNRDGTMLASGDYKGMIILWRTSVIDTIGQTLTALKGATSPLFTPDGKIFTGADDGTVRLQDPGTGTLKTFDDMAHYPTAHPEDRAIQKLALSNDGHILAAGRVDGTILLWNLSTKEVSHFIAKKPLQKIVLSSDGHILAATGGDGTLTVWDSVKKSQLYTFHVKEPSFVVLPLALNGNGTQLAAANCGKLVVEQDDCELPQVLLWNLNTRNPSPRVLSGHDQAVTDVAFSPDGHLLASSAKDGIILWDMNTNKPKGKPLTVPVNSTLQTDYYDSLLFSPDGKLLASFGYPSVMPFAIVLWDVSAHQPYAHPIVESSATNGSMAFKPDSQQMLSVFTDTDTDTDVFLLQDIALPLWQQRACTIANGYLTQDEWDLYLKEEVYSKKC